MDTALALAQQLASTVHTPADMVNVMCSLSGEGEEYRDGLLRVLKEPDPKGRLVYWENRAAVLSKRYHAVKSMPKTRSKQKAFQVKKKRTLAKIAKAWNHAEFEKKLHLLITFIVGIKYPGVPR